MAPQTESVRLANFLPQIGVDPNGGKVETLMELMNITLHCLGAVRVLCTQIEQERQIAWATSTDKQSKHERDGFAHWTLRKTFSIAVRRILQHVVKAECPHNLDPSRHIVESFPNNSNSFGHDWLAAHWAVLGDPEEHKFVLDGCVDERHTSLDKDMAARNKPDNIMACIGDERIWMVRTLVPFKPSTVSETDMEGRTVLHVAARLDSVPLFHCVLKLCQEFHGSTLDTPNFNGALPLHNAARFSTSKDVFNAVADAYPGALTVTNNDGMFPLHWAAAKNRSLGIIQHLLHHQRDAITVVNSEACLPLHCAGQNDCIDVVRAICDAYPQAIEIRDHEGGLPLHHACCLAENVDVVRFMYENYRDAIKVAQERDHSTPLHLAAGYNTSPNIIRYILSVCPDAAYFRDRDQWCPAHCMLNPSDKVKWLDRRLECLRLILKASSNLEDLYHISQCDGVARLVLRRLKDQDIQRFRNLNWNARKPAILLMTRLAQEVDNSQMIASSARIYSTEYRYLQALFNSKNGCGALPLERQIDLDQNLAMLLLRLVARFMSPEGLQIPSGLLRKIVGFL